MKDKEQRAEAFYILYLLFSILQNSLIRLDSETENPVLEVDWTNLLSTSLLDFYTCKILCLSCLWLAVANDTPGLRMLS